MPKQGHIGGRLTSGDLVVEFVWADDRFAHTISQGDRTLAASTAEGVETPVYQEVHQQGDLVFASGMSGDRHWSASVEPTDAGFLFDVACRAKSPAPEVGVVYDGAVFGIEADTNANEAPANVSTTGAIRVVQPAAPPGPPPVTVRFRYSVRIT